MAYKAMKDRIRDLQHYKKGQERSDEGSDKNKIKDMDRMI